MEELYPFQPYIWEHELPSFGEVVIQPPPAENPFEFPPQNIFTDDALLRFVDIGNDWLWDRHPEMYKEAHLIQGYDYSVIERYHEILRSIDFILGSFKNLLREMENWLDISLTPYQLLPLVSPLLGIDFNFDLPEEFARRELANAIYLWERKGTRLNITEWVSIISNCGVSLREYYKEVLRCGVWGQKFAGKLPYATTPDVNEYHALGKWNQTIPNYPWYFPILPDTNYGLHGFSPTITEDPTRGYLFRNHAALYLYVPEALLDVEWYNTTFALIFSQKVPRIVETISLFGIIWHFFSILTTEEIYEEPEEPETFDVIGDTEGTLIESLCQGRIADVLFCWSSGGTYSENWVYATQQARYWIEYLDDILNNSDSVGDTPVPMEHGYLEDTIGPYVALDSIGDIPGKQGQDYKPPMSPWVLDQVITWS